MLLVDNKGPILLLKFRLSKPSHILERAYLTTLNLVCTYTHQVPLANRSSI